MSNKEFDKKTDIIDSQTENGDSSDYIDTQSISKVVQRNKTMKIVQYVVRGLVSFAAIFISFSNTFFHAGTITEDPTCIDDKLFTWTENINKYFRDNSDNAKLLLIISSLLLDIQFVAGLILWFFKGKSWKPFVALIFISILKFVIDILFNFRYPEEMIWEYPGFPSIMVSYSKTSTFFFSYNVAVSMLLTLEAFQYRQIILVIFGVITIILYSFTAIFFRFHFSIDIGSALVASHYFYYIAKPCTKYFNRLLPLSGEDESINENGNEKDLNFKVSVDNQKDKDKANPNDSSINNF
jgi:hypothetical protein